MLAWSCGCFCPRLNAQGIIKQKQTTVALAGSWIEQAAFLILRVEKEGAN